MALLITATFGLAGCNLLEMFSGSDYQYDAEKVQASIDSLTQSGYKITVRYIQTGTENGNQPEIQSSGFTIAASGYFWECKQEGKTIIMDFSGDENYVLYEKADGDEKWTKTVTPYADMGSKETIKSLYVDVYLNTFTNYGILAAGLKNKGEVTIAGRACTKYEAGASLLGFSYKNEYYIDNETGLCLKNIIAVGSTTEGSGTTSYECTEFKVGHTVVLPADGDCVDNEQE